MFSQRFRTFIELQQQQETFQSFTDVHFACRVGLVAQDTMLNYFAGFGVQQPALASPWNGTPTRPRVFR